MVQEESPKDRLRLDPNPQQADVPVCPWISGSDYIISNSSDTNMTGLSDCSDMVLNGQLTTVIVYIILIHPMLL